MLIRIYVKLLNGDAIMMRLDKIISSTGICSRREVRQIIKRITVDGRPAKSSDEKVDPTASTILIDGEPIDYRTARYYMLNKPAGYISATEDRKEKTVMELLPQQIRKIGLFPVGRLDKDAEGLLILTDDGDFAHRVMSPKSGIKKLYLVKTGLPFAEDDVKTFEDGIILGDGTKCLPAELKIVDGGGLVTVREGKYHQVKRMCAAAGKPVEYLKRLKIGELELDNTLKPGEFRELDKEEVLKIFNG